MENKAIEFTVQEKGSYGYSLIYDQSKLKDGQTIEDYINDECDGNPWLREGVGVIVDIISKGIIDFTDTDYSTIDFE